MKNNKEDSRDMAICIAELLKEKKTQSKTVICPDCKSECVKTHREHFDDNKSYWTTGWECECVYDGHGP